MFKYITRASLFLIAIFLYSCEQVTVQPDDTALNSKPGAKIAEVVGIGQYDIELQDGYDEETTDENCGDSTVYAWTWEITKNCEGYEPRDCKDLSHVNFYFCPEVQESICAAYYSTNEGDTWTEVDVEFRDDHSLGNGDCSEHESDDVLKFDIGLDDGETLLVRIVTTGDWVVSDETTQALFKFGTTCEMGYVEGPSCEEEGGGQGEPECCYTCETGWAGTCDFPYCSDDSKYFIFNRTGSNVIPIYVDGNTNIGSVEVTRVLVGGVYKYRFEFDIDDDWYLSSAQIQVFPGFPSSATWYRNGCPRPAYFCTRWVIDECPVFEEVNGCWQLTDPDYEWPDLPIITSTQLATQGRNIALHVTAFHKECEQTPI